MAQEIAHLKKALEESDKSKSELEQKTKCQLASNQKLKSDLQTCKTDLAKAVSELNCAKQMHTLQKQANNQLFRELD